MIGMIITLISIAGTISGATITGMVVTEMLFIVIDALRHDQSAEHFKLADSSQGHLDAPEYF